MTASLKAIETVYRGHRYRSRLEARWAVFFDVLGVAYQYEPEGFELGAAGRYLPDFWMPTWKRWIEIKAIHPTKDENRKMAFLLDKMPDAGGIVLYGQPWPMEHGVVRFHRLVRGDERAISENTIELTEFSQCRRCDGICMTYFDRNYEGHLDVMGWTEIGPHTCQDHGKEPVMALSGFAPKIKAAYAAARGARFEHGERGR